MIQFEAARAYGTFPIAQLARAIWQDFSDSTPPPEGAPEHWRLAFATADVVITGWRLHKLAGYLREQKLAVVREINGYPDYPEHEPFVAKIMIYENDEPDDDTPPTVEIEDGGNNAPLPLPPDKHVPLVRRRVR